MTAEEFVKLYKGYKVKIWTTSRRRKQEVIGIVDCVDTSGLIRIKPLSKPQGGWVCYFRKPYQIKLVDEYNMKIGDKVKYIGMDYTCAGISGEVIGMDALHGLAYINYYHTAKAKWIPIYNLQVVLQKEEPLPLPG